MATPLAAMSGVPFTLQDAKTTGNGEVLAIPSSIVNHNIIITAAADVTSGAVQIETSNTYDNAGTWAPVGGGPITVIAATDIIYNFVGVFNFIRARISTTIAGGSIQTVTVKYEGARR